MDSYCHTLLSLSRVSALLINKIAKARLKPDCLSWLATLWSIREIHKCWLIMPTFLSYYCQYDFVHITFWNLKIYIAPFYVPVKKRSWLYEMILSWWWVLCQHAVWSEKFVCPENGGSRFLWNGGFLVYDKGSHSKILISTALRTS